MRRYRGDAGTRDRDARSQLDSVGVVSRQGHSGVAVRPDHLGVGDPGRVVAQLLDFLVDLPVVDLGLHRDTKFHRPVSSLEPWGSVASATV